MTNQDMRQYAEGQVAFWTRQIEFANKMIGHANWELARCRKADKEQKEWAKTYNNGEFADLYEGRYQSEDTKKALNERRRYQRELKRCEKELAHYQKLVDENIEPKAEEPENKKEEDTMETKTEITLNTPKTFEREGGRSAVIIIKLWRRLPTDNWTLMDDDHATWYRKSEWDEDGKIAYYMPDSVKGQRILMTEQELNDMINNTKEETTMKTTTIDLVGGIVRFELNDTTYTYNIETKRYAKITPDGKTKRIGKAEYDEAKVAYDQKVLDDQPSRVEVENDLDKPAVLDEHGCVDCRKCNCDKCVHRNCMRRNPRNVGGLGECPRLDNGIVSEAEKVAEETGMELAEAELAVNVRNEQKKARKARKSKDIAYEGNGVTLTAKQVDFLREMVKTDMWDGFDTMIWTDVLCDEIGGQFAGKPMTVGAMISTLCEKGLAERSKGDFTDPVTNRTRKSTYMGFTGLGENIAEELGL